MSIAWNEALAVGDAVIDSDHRRMMALIAELESAAAGQFDCHTFGATLSELARLTAEHFTREEELQAAIGFPELDAHRASHDMLLKRLDAVQTHYADGCDEVRAGMIRTLGDSLATWLVVHITTSDMEFKPYVAAGS